MIRYRHTHTHQCLWPDRRKSSPRGQGDQAHLEMLSCLKIGRTKLCALTHTTIYVLTWQTHVLAHRQGDQAHLEVLSCLVVCCVSGACNDDLRAAHASPKRRARVCKMIWLAFMRTWIVFGVVQNCIYAPYMTVNLVISLPKKHIPEFPQKFVKSGFQPVRLEGLWAWIAPQLGVRSA